MRQKVILATKKARLKGVSIFGRSQTENTSEEQKLEPYRTFSALFKYRTGARGWDEKRYQTSKVIQDTASPRNAQQGPSIGSLEKKSLRYKINSNDEVRRKKVGTLPSP